MFRAPIATIGLLCCLAGFFAQPALVAGSEPVDFNRDIRRLLSDRCFRCHGPDSETREAGLRLDRRESAVAELDSGETAIVPGDTDASELIHRLLTTDESLRMPPPETGPPLSPSELKRVSQWILEGAPYDQHWSLKPVVRPPLPTKFSDSNGIDSFIRAQQEKRGLKANPEAEPSVLLRRVSLAVTGLPPAPQAMIDLRTIPAQTPIAGKSIGCSLRLVLANGGLGFGSIWLAMQIRRGTLKIRLVPSGVIAIGLSALTTKTLPFDQFTVEQLAGDMLPDPTNDQLIATAFHRNTMTNSEGGTDDEEFRNAAVVDRVNTTMQVWMGLTMGCAQCHDHKYDDISQEEYFQVFAIFNNTEDADRGDERPWFEELTQSQRLKKQLLADALKALAKVDADATDEAAKKRKQELQNQLNKIRGIRTPIMRELADSSRREPLSRYAATFGYTTRKYPQASPLHCTHWTRTPIGSLFRGGWSPTKIP